MKLLFLDVDGVLNSHEWFHRRHAMPEYHKAMEQCRQWYFEWDDREDVLHDQWDLDPKAVSELNRLVALTDTQVVVSSVWRGRRRDVFTEALRRQGYHQGLLGRTHHIEGWYDHTAAPRSEVHRGMEIEHWILRHVPQDERRDLRVVILDDESDMGRLLPWRVQTSTQTGLKPEHFEAVEEVLRRPVDDLLAVPNPLWTPKARAKLYPGTV